MHEFQIFGTDNAMITINSDTRWSPPSKLLLHNNNVTDSISTESFILRIPKPRCQKASYFYHKFSWI